jgi:hypothetical protein
MRPLRSLSLLRETAWLREADARTRTGDPFITSEVLYQLSYVGGRLRLASFRRRRVLRFGPMTQRFGKAAAPDARTSDGR